MTFPVTRPNVRRHSVACAASSPRVFLCDIDTVNGVVRCGLPLSASGKHCYLVLFAAFSTHSPSLLRHRDDTKTQRSALPASWPLRSTQLAIWRQLCGCGNRKWRAINKRQAVYSISGALRVMRGEILLAGECKITAENAKCCCCVVCNCDGSM